jgi:hypothetical protein
MREFADHCYDCWKFEDCNQKDSMVSGTEPENGFLVGQDYFCAYCLPDTTDEKPFTTDYMETDTPIHCCNCGSPLHHNPTEDCIEYVREAIETGEGCCRVIWPEIYSVYLS